MAVVMAVMALAARFIRRRQGFGSGPRAAAGAGATKAAVGRNGASTPRGAPAPAGAAGLGGLFGGARGNRRARPEPPFDIVYRRAVAKGAWICLVEASGKRFLIGTTEQQVTMLSELPAEVVPDILAIEEWDEPGRMPVSLEGEPELARSGTAWKLALDSLRERTVRR